MKQVIYVGKIEKGRLVKCKADTRKFMEAHVEMARRMAAMQYVEIDITVKPDGGSHVPGSHS